VLREHGFVNGSVRLTCFPDEITYTSNYIVETRYQSAENPHTEDEDKQIIRSAMSAVCVQELETVLIICSPGANDIKELQEAISISLCNILWVKKKRLVQNLQAVSAFIWTLCIRRELRK